MTICWPTRCPLKRRPGLNDGRFCIELLTRDLVASMH
jgi:hypothetical protein